MSFIHARLLIQHNFFHLYRHFDKEKERASAKYEELSTRYRILLVHASDICNRLPKIVMNDILRRSKREVMSDLRTLEEEFAAQEREWKSGHKRNEFMLKPSLSHPGAKKKLDALVEVERVLHENTIQCIAAHRDKVMRTARSGAVRFIQRLQHACMTLIKLFDSMVTLDDISSAPSKSNISTCDTHGSFIIAFRRWCSYSRC
jgi:hypothetical protein